VPDHLNFQQSSNIGNQYQGNFQQSSNIGNQYQGNFQQSSNIGNQYQGNFQQGSIDNRYSQQQMLNRDQSY
jgi:hypothetical protein